MSILQPSSLDERTWQRCRKGYAEVNQLIAQLRFYRPQDADELAENVFYACFQLEPVVRSDATGFVADVVRQMLAHPRWPRTRELIGDNTMHALGTCYDLLRSLVGTAVQPELVPLAIEMALEHIIAIIGSYEALQKAYWQQRKPMTLENQMTIASRAQANPKLARVAKIAGRLKNIALRVHKTRTPEKQEDVRDIELGNTLPKVLPAELAALGIGQTQPVFLTKYDERRLMQRQVDGPTQEGQGPIVVALDDSYSMTGSSMVEDFTREEWAKAIVLALYEVACVEKRDFAVIHFGYKRDMKAWHFKHGQATVDELLNCIDFFFCSMGTTFDLWMQEAMRLVDTATYNKADVIVLSDGAAYIDEAVQARWDALRAARGMRSYGIMIGRDKPGGLSFVCDRIMSMAGADDEDLITSTVFAI